MIARRSFLAYLASLLALPRSIAQPTQPAFVPVWTRSHDNSRSGANLKETVLTQDSVRTQGIRNLYSLRMEGDARGSEAQTLIVPNITTPDGFRHDLAIQATMGGGLWGFDANTGEVLWAVKLGRPVKGSRAFDMYLINDNWGILGTPVIDMETRILYCVAWSSMDRSPAQARYYAHAINVADGSHAAPPVDLSAARYAPGRGLDPMVMGTVFRKQRAGLVLMKSGGQKVVMIAFAAGAESADTNHGWVVAVSTNPFRITAAWNNSPRKSGGGIWQASQAPAADNNGNIYFICGNGAFDGVTDFGECFTKLHYTPPTSATAMGSITCLDWWTPFTDAGRIGIYPATAEAPDPDDMKDRQSAMMVRMPMGDAPVNATPDQPKAAAPADLAMNASNAGWLDQDLGSAGALLIPQYNLLLGAGKDGILYVLNSADMGKTKLSDFATPDGIRANYAKAKHIIWFTFFPGFDVSPTPTDLTKLNIDFEQRTHHMHSSPIYYDSPVHGPMVFCCGENSSVRAWQVGADGKVSYLANGDEIASPNAPLPGGGMPGGMMSLSANGKKDGTALLVVCFPYGNANKEVTGGFFVIYDPEHFDTRPDGSKRIRALWRSQDWNIQYSHCKFNVPVVSGGKVFIPTYDGRVDVYGLA